MTKTYDVAVIGGGPGGYVAAIRSAQLGARVVLAEKDRLGGTCLVRGCIPTKALLTSAEVYHLATHGEALGVAATGVRFDWAVAQARKATIVDQLVKGVGGLLKANGVEVVTGSARLEGNGAFAVGSQRYTAADIVLATGSVPQRIPIPGAELCLDSDGILALKSVPKRLVVIGGGVVGMEFASLFATLGSEVTVLEALPQILPMVESDIANIYRRHFERLGGHLVTGAQVSGVTRSGRAALKVAYGSGEAEAEVVLLAAGRSPYTEGLGLEAAGVELDRGRVRVDDLLRTTAKGIYAIGDVIGGLMLAHVASYEGTCAVETIAGHERRPDYHAAPNCVYTDPEIANVGLTEKDAAAQGLAVDVGRFPLQASGRALTLGQAEGMIKVVSERGSGRIVGVQMIGPRVTDLVAEAALAIQFNHTVEDLHMTMHAHPTMAESLLEAALAAQGRAIHVANRRRTAPTETTDSASGTVAAVAHSAQEVKAVAPVAQIETARPHEQVRPAQLALKKANRDELLRLHRQMVLIRRFEERSQEQYNKAKIGGYCHLNIGEEATVVGGIAALRPEDWIFTSYREHGHAIARGIDPRAVMAELFGRETGTSRGRGGSMHIFDTASRFMGGYGIVGGHLPLAVGAAWTVRYRRRPEVVFCMFGDGATNIGAFHESLNYAKVFGLPVVWFCVNNKYGMGTAVERASSVPDMYRKGAAYDMESIQVDGTDLVEVLSRTQEIVEKTRKDLQPRFIEAVCYRFKGHSVVDPDKYRPDAEKAGARNQDPIGLFEARLLKAKLATTKDLEAVRESVEAEVKAVVEFADASPSPDVAGLYNFLYDDEWNGVFTAAAAETATAQVRADSRVGTRPGESTNG